MSPRLILVADTAFIDSGTTQQHSLLSVFPRERGDGAYRDTLDNLLRRSQNQSACYDAMLPKLTPAFAAYMPAAGDQVRYFVRPVMVTVTSLFVDRCIRVLHRLRQHPARTVAAAAVEPIGTTRWLSDVSQTWHLNQDLIQRAMAALGFETVQIFNRTSYPEYPSEHPQPNLLFAPQRPGLMRIIAGLKARYYAALRGLSSGRARFQSLGFGADEYHLSKRGLLGPFGVFQRPLELELEAPEPDAALRGNLFSDIEDIARHHFEVLLWQLDPHVRPSELDQLGRAYARLMVDWFPTGFLEGLQVNLTKVAGAPQLANMVGVIGHDAVSTAGYFVGAAARLAGKRVIGVQHGGHYGYIEDMSLGAQFEYAHCDTMVTWGWTRIDAHLPQCETVPLPCPKLSERPLRANYVRAVKRLPSDARDILFLSNLWHRFPHVSTCGQARVDFVDDRSASEEDLLRAIGDAGLTVDHKPYNMKFVDLYPEHYRRLEVAGGPAYRLLKSTHKGLTVDQIKTCRILLWDQIGSGTLECFTSGVPTIVYWKRIYSREAPWAEELVAGLERCGVVHSDAGRLAEEVRIYLADPERWMADGARNHAIREFCRNFALTDSRWSDSWKRQLSRWS